MSVNYYTDGTGKYAYKTICKVDLHEANERLYNYIFTRITLFWIKLLTYYSINKINE